MLGIYYSNTWGAKSLPFMSTRLLTATGGKYPIAKVFQGGVLNEAALAQYGIPSLSGTFAFGMFMANAAVSTPDQIKRRPQHRLIFYFIDRRPHCPLLPLLGWGYPQGLQDCKRWKLR
jgi:OPT oligopeptide transporter protein